MEQVLICPKCKGNKLTLVSINTYKCAYCGSVVKYTKPENGSNRAGQSQTKPEEAKLEDTKISLLLALKELLDSYIINEVEFKKLRYLILTIGTIPLDGKDKSQSETLIALKNLYDNEIIEEENYNYIKNGIFKNE